MCLHISKLQFLSGLNREILQISMSQNFSKSTFTKLIFSYDYISAFFFFINLFNFSFLKDKGVLQKCIGKYTLIKIPKNELP